MHRLSSFPTRPVAALLGCLLLAPLAAAAEPWAPKMFAVVEHDFGVVARGSDTVFRFPVKNVFVEDVVLGSVRSSCGCTSASLENGTIKTHQVGYVVAKFNTRTFTGQHGATLTVSIVKPYPAEIQLKVRGNIRGDVVFEPGSVDFGQVDQGEGGQRRIRVTHSGGSRWRLTDLRSVDTELTANFVEYRRSGSQVGYDLTIGLLPSAAPGYKKTQLILVTNDAANPRIPIEVTAEVRPTLSVTPSTLAFGDVTQGMTVTKRMLVRGKRPFRLTAVTSPNESFAFEFAQPQEPALKQLVTVRYTATADPGRVQAPIVVETDLGETFRTSAAALATVIEAPAPAEDLRAADNRTALAR